MEENLQNTEEEKIEEHKREIQQLEDKIKNKKIKEKSKLRVKSKNNNNANKLIRVSNEFAERINNINDKREENGFDNLSGPKITDLIIKHKKYWKLIEEDIINFNTKLDLEEDGGDFKDEK